MKTILRILIIVILFVLISIVVSITIDDFFINTIFTVSGIMFSVGLGLIVTFNISGIKNKKYINDLRSNIDSVRNSFLQYFLISTISFILDFYLRQNHIDITTICYKEYHIDLNWPILFVLLMLYSIIYYIYNFIEIQKLNNEIFDKINE